ncbi:MAG: leucine--tRNA ligase [Candidatus Levyibacteriota bacterium]
MQNSKNKTKSDFNPQGFEAKWQREWESARTFSPNLENSNKPFYNLMMFPYPSAEGLHVGNMYAQTGADVYGRLKRMQGFDVFEPMGLDGFGIHSENYALKIGKNPMDQAQISQDRFYKQMKAIGTSIDWSRTLETYDPAYYKWTQWLFIQLFKAGLAYRKKAEVNWCPSCKTVLSDEQVIDTKCERCGTVVEKRDLEQWFFRITNYAERLLQNIEKLDWSEKVKIAQRNWIGKSEGAVLKFSIVDLDRFIKVFTTRPDTLFGATFVVVSPEHEVVASLLNLKFKIQNSKLKEIEKYVKKAKERTDQERTAEDKEKTGVFSGLYAVNPVNGEKIPVWIADYVLTGYGTGAIMAVPAHDTRDYAFAKKYGLPIIEVIKGKGSRIQEEAYVGDGVLVNSGEWNGLNMPVDMGKVLDNLEKNGIGERSVNYHLRDWLISRQRYWGPPIPMVYCETCFSQNKGEKEEMPGWYSVKLQDLPVLLPNVADWKPLGTGKSPLANHPEFYETVCPECGNKAVRETDVSDTFLDSSWYFLGYISDQITGKTKNSAISGNSLSKGIKIEQESKEEKGIVDEKITPWDPVIEQKWLPVTRYIGGAEHSVLHLLYSRFVSMVLHDLKFTHFEEPFSSFFAHGLIIKDGAKMSKSKGNVVVPDEYIKKYGADTLRTYLMFLGPFSEGGDFRDSGIEGMHRFLKRVWKLLSESSESQRFTESESHGGSENSERVGMMHKTIKKVTEDIEGFKYNTAIAALMEWYNFLSAQKGALQEERRVFLQLLAPFAPYMTEEIWNQEARSKNQEAGSIHLSAWPAYDEKNLVADTFTVVVQVNGKRRAEMNVPRAELENKQMIEQQATGLVSKYIDGSAVKKVVYVPGKIVNFVV